MPKVRAMGSGGGNIEKRQSEVNRNLRNGNLPPFSHAFNFKDVSSLQRLFLGFLYISQTTPTEMSKLKRGF